MSSMWLLLGKVQNEEELKSTRQFSEDQRQEFEKDMLDLENIKIRLMYEQKRADDASEKVEKLNEEVSKDGLINKTF